MLDILKISVVLLLMMLAAILLLDSLLRDPNEYSIYPFASDAQVIRIERRKAIARFAVPLSGAVAWAVGLWLINIWF